MASHPRPTSPYMLGQYYRLQLTSFTSFLHRVTGVYLAVGILALVYWLIAAAMGPAEFDQAQAIAGSIIGRVALFLWTGAFFYHLLNGIRHLVWDAGHGFDLPTAYRSGYAALILAAILTVVAWALGYWARGML